jgi:hypothetical protein
MTVLLIPVIRMLGFILCGVLANLICKFVLLGWTPKDEKGNFNILDGNRRGYLEKLLPPIARAILFFWGFHWINVEGVSCCY